ncbi:hypothetical protein KUV47_11370 [Vannielia litorea]|uniref:hypothetical protein n=1 Tax=Vannielia litorea TaxID=1217970 RepID=UPI001C98DF78|nr:hypothetical protein [Vannielia litorea]MBY6153814.1 hypothetical protein [Vannielia litorea]
MAAVEEEVCEAGTSEHGRCIEAATQEGKAVGDGAVFKVQLSGDAGAGEAQAGSVERFREVILASAEEEAEEVGVDEIILAVFRARAETVAQAERFCEFVFVREGRGELACADYCGTGAADAFEDLALRAGEAAIEPIKVL